MDKEVDELWEQIVGMDINFVPTLHRIDDTYQEFEYKLKSKNKY